MLPPPASLLLPRLSELAATEPTLSFLHFFRFPPMSPLFPARRLQLFCGFLRFFASLPPSSILFSFPLSPSPFPSPLQSSLSSPFPSGVQLRVPTPVPVPVPVLPFFVRFHPRSRSRSVPVPMTAHVPVTVSVPTPDSNPAPAPVRSFLPLGSGYPPRYDALVRTPGLANGAVGCSQAPPPVWRDGDACGMRVPAVKQKRIGAEDVLLLSLPPDVGTHRSMSPTCAVPV